MYIINKHSLCNEVQNNLEIIIVATTTTQWFIHTTTPHAFWLYSIESTAKGGGTSSDFSSS